MRQNASWTEARDLLLGIVRSVETETVPLDEAGGRILADDLTAEEDVPPFDRSAYDGYALRAADVARASEDTPVTLRIIETLPAGAVASTSVTPGTAVHLMTGAPLPPGADCVINFERTRFTEYDVTLTTPLRAGDNVVRRGEDVKAGTLLAPAGTPIDAGTAGTLAAQGIPMVHVFRRPVIGLISTGSEVVEADGEQKPGQIRNANRASLTALLKGEGCEVRYLGLAGDDAAQICERIEEGFSDCDAVLLTGGVSVGDWDVTPEAMQRAGAEILLRGVSMKPGMACAYGVRDAKLVIGLSGNPASSLTNFCACVLPALRRLCGRRNPIPPEITVRLARDFRKKSPSDRFLRGRLELTDGGVRFAPALGQGNAVLSSAIGCDAFALIPAGSGPVSADMELRGFSLIYTL